MFKGVSMSLERKAKYLLAFGIVNFVLYFVIQGVVTQHEYDFMTAFDLAVPFLPEYIWIYHSILPVIAVTMFLLVQTKRIFMTTFWSFVVAGLVLNTFYLVFPSFYPRTDFEITTISEFLLDFTRRVDGANNTFPSTHVTFSWILFWGVFYSKKAQLFKGLKSLYLLWAIGVSLSTLVLKQHYAVDVLSGISLAATCFFLVKPIIEYFDICVDETSSTT